MTAEHERFTLCLPKDMKVLFGAEIALVPPRELISILVLRMSFSLQHWVGCPHQGK